MWLGSSTLDHHIWWASGPDLCLVHMAVCPGLLMCIEHVSRILVVETSRQTINETVSMLFHVQALLVDYLHSFLMGYWIPSCPTTNDTV